LGNGVQKKNTVARLESNISDTQNILSPQKFFWVGYATGTRRDQKLFALKNRCW